MSGRASFPRAPSPDPDTQQLLRDGADQLRDTRARVDQGPALCGDLYGRCDATGRLCAQTRALLAHGPRRVLVADDCPDAADSLRALLLAWGHQAWVAYGGAEALRAAADFRPEVALLDIAMPGLDGYEVARRMRQMPGLGGVLLVALTGYGRDEDRRQARGAGFDRLLVKPYDPDEVQRLLG